MVNTDLSIGISETLDILNHMEETYVKKIPKKFRNFLEKNQSKNYVSKLDYTKQLKDMQLKEKTKDILAIIHMNYWCSPEEKKNYMNLLNENQKRKEKELREKYNPDNLFKKQQNVIEKVVIEEQPMDTVEYNSGIVNKIKYIFNFK